MPSMLDAVVVGAGPNGLTAAVELARRGFSVALFEAKGTVGGGARTEELTLPGFRHDPCSAAHPAASSSFVRKSGAARVAFAAVGKVAVSVTFAASSVRSAVSTAGASSSPATSST